MVVREDRDELRLEDAVGVPGHRGEQAPFGGGGDPRRHRGTAGAELDERAPEGLEQEVEIEELPNLGAVQDEHLEEPERREPVDRLLGAAAAEADEELAAGGGDLHG